MTTTSRRVDRAYIPAAVISMLCIGLAFTGKDVSQRMAISADAAWWTALTYHFFHANIFHLACNVFVLIPFKPRWMTLLVAYLSATLAAMMLAQIPGYGPTCGLSAVIFASFARRYASWSLKCWRIILVNIPFLLIPQVDGAVHLLSFFLSYFIWKAVLKYRKRLR